MQKNNAHFIVLLVLAVVLYGIHSYLGMYFFNITPFFPLWQIYLFLFITTALLVTTVYYQKKRKPQSVFAVFMVGTLIKMILALLFLLPLLLSDIPNKILDVVNFFIPYLIFLTAEVFIINKFLLKNNA
ncbi:MAG: hypothetical protein CR989_03010 [Flavobacteriales bacterium]|nr:MAG: hypothetical protein CR989_03010 [Flavobacteriales bacterium]